ncbi:uncharacterized protein LOC143210627 isoform X2 [Lasioglossum baleicum]|uniref:uncharacterized protein LOC143210627 isoform X2 n=1 Tax=Lasioglossum baleicum TaxID=434251 RepID=UPI003FCE5425
MILISYFDRNTIKGLEICRYNALETIIFSLDQIIFSLDQIIFSLDQIIFSLDTILPATVLFSDTGKWAQRSVSSICGKWYQRVYPSAAVTQARYSSIAVD